MATNVLLLHYNNYFNRTIKKLDTVSAYTTADSNNVVCTDINFVPGDGIITSLVLGKGQNPAALFTGSKDNFDYLVVYDSGTGTPIISRWFIMEERRTREGQYEFTLRRDVIADNLTHVLNSNVYIEKGNITDITSPFIFNKENLEVNQIKDWEFPIKDKSECAWIVGFISPTQEGFQAQRKINDITYTVTCPGPSTRKHLTDSPYDMFCIPFDVPNWRQFKSTSMNYWVTPWGEAGLAVASAIPEKLADASLYDIQILPYCPIPEIQRMYYKHQIDFQADIYDFNKNYEIDYIFENDGNDSTVVNFLIWCSSSNATFDVNMTKELYYMTSTHPSSIVRDTAYLIDDAPGAFAFSVGEITGSMRVYKVDRSNGLTTFMGYYNKLSAGPSVDGNPLYFYYRSTDEDPTLSIKSNDYRHCGFYYMFILETNSPTVSGDHNCIFTAEVDNPYNNIGRLKASNDLDVYRICSSNFQSIFEFSPAKAKGFQGFNIDYTYLPNQSYIHISPIMSGLYGYNFNKIDDLRGLVDSSNHSITRLSSAWANYVAQNSMYQKIFDRQVENMDVMHKYDRIGNVTSAVAGTVQGAATGAAAGAMVGGPWGAAIGGVVGAGASLAGGIADVAMSEGKYEEQRQFAIDNFNYSLQNIKAIPESLAKLTSFVYNTRYYPFLEYYTCTQAERAAYSEKIYHDGMTIMQIGYLGDYVTSYDPEDLHFYRGELIWIAPGFKGDAHMVNEIYNELKKGVYL